MSNNKKIVTLAINSALALSVSATAQAIDTLDVYSEANPPSKKGLEMCGGRVLSGQNACPTSENACAGLVEIDNHPEAFVWLPTGTCEKLVGTRLIKIIKKKSKNKSKKRT